MKCGHEFSFLREVTTESKPSGTVTIRAHCGNCGVPLMKETMGKPSDEGIRPLHYSLPVDEALKPSTA